VSPKCPEYSAMSAALLSLAMLFGTAPLNADDDGSFIEEITIVGQHIDQRQIAGSATHLSLEELQKYAYADIQRIARSVPGVSIQVEDGYGLRPNISIRGVSTERSGRITLLEDNVLISPAPYSAPSAYYFPTIGRMSAIEVLKGPAAITQGPYTIGGALNMISTPIPSSPGGNAYLEGGQDSTYRLHASWGARTESGFGVLVEAHQWRSDGYQDIDRSSHDTGLDVVDYTVKLSYAPDDSRHRVALKLQYADQDSDQSYLGLTDSDFDSDAFRRYGLSELDNIETEHEQIILRYEFDVTDDLKLTATVYDNQHQRDWFKTEGIDFDGSSDAQSFSRTSWFNVVQAVNRGDTLGALTPSDLQSILNGTTDTASGSIQLRSNDREYFSRGMQLRADWTAEIGATTHAVEVGVRYHEDEEDRLQRNSTYSQVDAKLVLDDLGLLGNAGNRIQEAEAWALHIYDRIEFGNWAITPGLRYEDIEQKRTRYETRSGHTSNPASRASDNVRDARENNTRVWLPGIGVIYTVNESVALVGGVHKGFTAPSNAPGVDEETAINYEAGFRWTNAQLDAELMFFYSDYDNLLGECTSSSGSDCEAGDAFNGDAATVKGLELYVAADLASQHEFSVPLQFNYTYTDGEFDTDIADTDFFGDVSSGDPIPYTPEHQFNVSLGLETGPWATYLSANYVDEVCVRAACQQFEKTDDALTLDWSGRYDVNDMLTLFARVENLTGEDNILGRHPYGARPNKDRTAAFGVRISF